MPCSREDQTQKERTRERGGGGEAEHAGDSQKRVCTEKMGERDKGREIEGESRETHGWAGKN